MIRAILACDNQGGISKDGTMPWPRNAADLAHFKKTTTGAMVVMGRKTWEAADMPSPLPNRTNIVVTRNTEFQLNEAHVISDNVTSRLTSLAKSNTVFVIGGATLVNQLMDQIEVFHLTRITGDYNCDTFIDLDALEEHFVKLDSVEIDKMTRFETYIARKLHVLSIPTIF